MFYGLGWLKEPTKLIFSNIFLAISITCGSTADFLIAFKYLKASVGLYKPHLIKWIEIF